MALVKCPECGKENISDMAEICPICGFNVKKHFEKVEALKKEELQKLEIEKNRLLLQEKQKEKAEKRKENNKILCDKIWGSKKKKVCWTITTILVIFTFLFCYKSTEKIRLIKDCTETNMKQMAEIENNIYQYTYRNGKEYFKLGWNELGTADRFSKIIRDLYSEISINNKNNYRSFLKSKYSISWEELNKKWDLYGFSTEKKYNNASEEERYFKKIIKDLYEKKEQKDLKINGKVSVTELKRTSSYDNYLVTGSVKNTTKNTVYFVKVKITLLNNKGEIINTDNTYAVGDEGLKSGESSTFTCYIDKVEGTTKCKASVYDYR